MNKLSYRLIFNRRRGQVMAVAESAGSGVGASDGANGETRGTRRAGTRRIAALRPLLFHCLAAFGRVAVIGLATGLPLLGTMAPAQAQIVAYKNPPAGQTPTVLSAGNGVPLVNIRTPNASGLSHNSYTQFDVGASGAILNNSPENSQTQLGGWVQGNPWLATGSARVILNEVFSSNPSLLNGYIEVAGQRAQVIIARAVTLNAGLWANTLKIATGANLVDAAHTGATPLSNPASNPAASAAPAFALDVATLGGMYAGKITLIGTEAGVGVRNAGTINASAGEVVLTAAGHLENLRTLTAAGNVSVNTQGDVSNRGTIYAQGATSLTSQGHINHGGLIAAQGDTTLTAQGAITALVGSSLGAGILGDGTLAGNGQLTVTAGERIALAGQSLSAGDQRYAGTALDFSGSQMTGRNLTLTATQGDATLTGAQVSASGTFTASTPQTLRTDGATLHAAQLTLTAHDLSNRAGTLLQLGTGDFALTLPGDLDNTGGKLAGNSRNMTVAARSIDNTDGTLLHAGSGTASLTVSDLLNNLRGAVAGAAVIAIDTQGLNNTQGLIVGNALALDTHGNALANTGGQIRAAGPASTDTIVISSGTLDNDQGLIQGAHSVVIDTHGQTLTNTRSGSSGGLLAGGDLMLATGDLNNQAGLLGANGAVALSAAQVANTQGGLLLAGGELTLSASALDNRGGQLQGLGNVALTVDTRLDNAGSLLRAGATLAVHADTLVNAGTAGANQGIEATDIQITARQSDNQQGALRATRSLQLTSPGLLDNRQGLISSAGTLAIGDPQAAARTLTITNTGGSIVAQTAATVDARSLTGDGTLASNGDLTVRLASDYTHTGNFQARGNARLETAGQINNQALLQAGQTLTLTAAHIDNQASGTLQAGALAATATQPFTNRGLIDAGDTRIAADTINNLGAGRIYGDRVALSANILNNLPENGTAPVIAARERLDLGVGTLNNQEHALLFSAGDLVIGGALDASHRASGLAGTLNNGSATIEALGNLALNARTINNTNNHFSTEVQVVGTDTVTEYQGSGAATRYLAGTPDVYVYNDESDHLHTPEGNYESWIAYRYTRTIQETRITASDPGKILAGGGIRITGDTLTNDKSQIIAGGTLAASVGSLSNLDVAGTQIVTDAGTVTNYWRNHKKGRDDTGSSTAAYTPPDVVQSITLTPTLFQQNTAPSGSGTQIAALNNPVSRTTTEGSGMATANLALSAPSAVSAVARQGSVNTTLPNNRLYRVNPDPNRHVLVESDPQFANYRAWLSSDYMSAQLKFDPNVTQTRLGDGFYEQQLVRDQVAQLTGQRFLAGYASDEAQYRALMDNGLTVAQAWQLRPGVALTAAQMAQLTSDIVWLVEQSVTLPDGSTTRALVPQVYLRPQAGDLAPSGALLAGQNVELNVRGDAVNQGSIAGREVVSLTAENVLNLGGRIAGNDTAVIATNDLLNRGGTITGVNGLTALAGHDLTVESGTNTGANASGSRTTLDRVAGLYVSGEAGQLIAQAGNNLNLIAAAVQSQGSAALAARNNLNLATVTTGSANQIVWDEKNRRSDTSTAEVGSVVSAKGEVQLVAGVDISARAATVSSETGFAAAVAGRNLSFMAGQATASVDESHQHSESGFLNSTTRSTQDTLDQTTARGSSFSGNTVTLVSGQDTLIQGSNVVSDAGTRVAAGQNLTIEAATNTQHETHFTAKETSGLLSSGGIGFTIGSRLQSVDQQGTGTTAAASTVGSVSGNVVLSAGQTYTQTGSDVLSPQGDIAVTAKTVNITEARETAQQETETKFKQSGLTVAITSPVISAIQTAQQMSQAASNTSDSRMKALAAGSTALSAKGAYDAVAAGQGDANGRVPTGQKDADGNPEMRDGTAADQAGGIGISITVGGSQSQSQTVQTSDSGRGSTIKAGGDVVVVASGDGQNSNLTVQGSEVSAGNSALLAAENNLNLVAGRNTASQHSTNSSTSGAVGVAIQMGGSGSSGFSMGVTASASAARGKADGSDVTFTNTHVEAGRQLTLQSGGDTTLRGAVANADQISANVGGNLAIESLQDTSTFKSSQQSIGGSVTVGYGASGSLSASQAKVNSNYASVSEQSALRAGDGGFTVAAKGNTTLAGGAITSTQAAIDQGRNTFATGGKLSTTDLQNHAEYSAQSIGISVGMGGAQPGATPSAALTGAGIGSDKGSSRSTTTAGISGIAGNAVLRTGDAESGLGKIFDAEKVQREINAQMTITKEFTAQSGQAITSYATNQRKTLNEQLKVATTDEERQRLQQEIKDVNMQERALNILVGGLTGMLTTSLAKESLSAAAEKMRDLMIEDSKKFAGVVDKDGKPLFSNLSGPSDGVRGDGQKVGGTRVDLDLLCGPDSKRCSFEYKSDGSVDQSKPVTFLGEEVSTPDGSTRRQTLDEFIATPEGQKMSGDTGGIQGIKGTLFGVPYEAGGWQDKLIESFAGSHDMIGGKLSGLYDEQGNIRRGMSDTERAVYDKGITVGAIPLAAPFAAAEGLSPAVWDAISILIKAAR